jgi:hypothetical protein
MATTGIENGIYNNRRKKVKRHITTHFLQISNEVRIGGGPYLQQAMDLARIPAERRSKLLSELQSNSKLYFGKDIEPLVVAVMVHGN